MRIRSSFEKHFALIGESGSQKPTKRPPTNVAQPNNYSDRQPTPSHRHKKSTHKEQNLPVLNCRTLDLRDAVCDETADALLEAVHRVEGADDERLLLARVPHRREEDEGRLADALEDAEERAHDDEAGEVVADGGAGEDGTPCGDVEGEVLGDGEALDEAVGGELPDEDGDVD